MENILDVIAEIKELTGLTLVELRDKLKEDNNGWIPVEREIPKEDGYYLTCDEYGNIHTFYHYKDEIYPFAIAPNNQRFYQPIAWQPLPPVYKGE